jgi:nucleoporin NUP82
MSLKEDLLEQAKELAVAEEPVASPNLKIPSEIRKAKIAQVMSLLDRETALVEGARSRLERLSMA